MAKFDEICYKDECSTNPVDHCYECGRASCAAHLINGHCDEQGCKARLDTREKELSRLNPLVDYLRNNW